jgi:hypothetical protein
VTRDFRDNLAVGLLTVVLLASVVVAAQLYMRAIERALVASEERYTAGRERALADVGRERQRALDELARVRTRVDEIERRLGPVGAPPRQ